MKKKTIKKYQLKKIPTLTIIFLHFMIVTLGASTENTKILFIIFIISLINTIIILKIGNNKIIEK